MDEATSALDNESEKIVQDALNKAKVGRTTLIIAHRLSTIRNADIIVGMSGGQIKEMGSHEDLMVKKGIYYELVSLQTIEKSEKLTKLSNEDNMPKINSDTEIEDSSDDEIRKPETERKMSKISIKSKKESSEKGKPEKKRKHPFFYEKNIFKIQRPEMFWILAGTFAQFLNGATFPGMVLIFSSIYSLFSLNDPTYQRNESLKYMGIIFAIAIGSFFLAFTGSYSITLSGTKLTKRIRVKMFEAMLRQEIAFHDEPQNRSNILSTQLTTVASLCKGLTSDKIGVIANGLMGSGVSIVVSLIINWKLSLVMIIFVPITFFSGVLTGRSVTNTKIKGNTIIDEGGRLTTDTIENIRTVVSLGRERHFINEFQNTFNFGFKKTLLLLHAEAFFYAVSYTVIFFNQIAAFSFGYYLMKNDGLALTNLFRVYAMITFSSMVLGRVYAQIPNQGKARNAAKTAVKIISRKSKIDS